MTLGSLFDGSGTAPLAATMCGIEVAWVSEIEKYACKVTAARFPGVPNHGDITKMDGGKIQPVDIIVGGSPCQDLSIAGKQAGLVEGKRSNLFFEMIRVIKEMREATNDTYPNIVVWENVPGAFSSNKGQDFRAVLENFCKIADTSVTVSMPDGGKWKPAGAIVGDGYSIAWRVLDAQFWGVPQRRRRIYLVADFGGKRAAEILFKREGLRRDFKTGREAWQGVASDTERGVGGGCTSCYNESGKGYWMPGFGCLRTEGENRPSRPGHCVVEESGVYAIDAVVTTGGNCTAKGPCHYDNVCPAVKTCHAHAVCYGIDCRNATLDEEKTHTIQAHSSGGFSPNCTPSVLVYENHPQDSRCTGPLSVMETVSQKYGTGGNNTPIVVEENDG